MPRPGKSVIQNHGRASASASAPAAASRMLDLKLQRRRMASHPASRPAQTRTPGVQRQTSQAAAPSAAALPQPPRRRTARRYPSATTGSASIVEVIAPTLPDCQKKRNCARLEAHSSSPAQRAPVHRTPAPRTASTPSHGKPAISQKASAGP